MSTLLNLLQLRIKAYPTRLKDNVLHVDNIVITHHDDDMAPYFEFEREDKSSQLVIGKGAYSTAAVAVVASSIKQIIESFDGDITDVFRMTVAVQSTIDTHYRQSMEKTKQMIARL